MKTLDQAAKDYVHPMVDEGMPELDIVFSSADFKNGVEFAQKWISVEDEMPIPWEQGHWDGKRSDFVLAKNKLRDVFIARTYEGYLDGSHFCDFVDRNDNILSDIIEWRPIEIK